MFKVNNVVILVAFLLTLNIFHTLFSVSIVNFEHVIAGWVTLILCYIQTLESKAARLVKRQK